MRQFPLFLLLLLLAFMADYASGQETAPEQSENSKPQKLADAKWYSIEIIVFLRNDQPAEAAPAGEDLWLQRTKRQLPSHLRALIPSAGTQHQPKTVQQFAALLDSIEYQPTVRIVPMDSTPELEDISNWLQNFRRYHKAEHSLAAIANPDALEQYWPYIKPLSLEETATPEDSIEDFNLPDFPEFIDEEEVALKKLAVVIPADQVFRRVIEKELQLQSEAKRLDRQSNYEILLHKSWRQPLPQRGAGLPVLIQRELSEDDSEKVPFMGIVTTELGRFLHARVVFWYPRWQWERDRGLESAGDLDQQSALQLQNAEQTNESYMKLDTKVRLRSGELHYLDHPHFGVVLMITNYAPEGSS